MHIYNAVALFINASTCPATHFISKSRIYGEIRSTCIHMYTYVYVYICKTRDTIHVYTYVYIYICIHMQHLEFHRRSLLNISYDTLSCWVCHITLFLVEYVIRPTQSIMYVPLLVNTFQKRILLIVQYTYLESCSEDLILQNVILRTRSCSTSVISQHSWLLHFHPTEICRAEIMCTSGVPVPKRHFGGASPWILWYDSYGVAMISRLLKIIGLFCRISSLL